MAKPLETISIVAPGFFGVNTQASSVALEQGFALEATNCVIDSYGRLGSRKGWSLETSGHTGVELQGAHDFVSVTGLHYHGVWSDTDFYIADGSTLTSVTYSGSNTLNGVNWQAATLNDAAFLFDKNYKPLYFNPSTSTLDDIENAGHGVVPQGNTVLSAYGRLWIAGVDSNRAVVYWSDLADGTNFQSGDSGSIDLTAVLVGGNDEVIALGAHAGRLIIFCKDNIVIYGDNSSTSLDPTTMQLVEVMKGTGCIARDSVQNTGTDIIFLSKNGLMSLGRLIQEKSQPERDLTKNIRDEFVRTIAQEAPEDIRSVYNIVDGIYLLFLPSFQMAYCLDMKQVLQDGAARITTWDSQSYNNLAMIDGEMWFLTADGVGVYGGYSDNGSSYRMKYYTNYFDFGDSTRLKHLKRLGVTVIGGVNQQIFFKAGFDYSNAYRSFTATVDGGSAATYNVSEYNESEYTSGVLADNIRTPMGGSGSVVQAGFEVVINGAELSMQRLDIYVKQGRMY